MMPDEDKSLNSVLNIRITEIISENQEYILTNGV